MPVHYPMISMFLYTLFYNYKTKLELCSMATSGRVTAALSMVSVSDAFTGVHGEYTRGSKMADRTVSAVYGSHGFLLCIISGFLAKGSIHWSFQPVHQAPLDFEASDSTVTVHFT